MPRFFKAVGGFKVKGLESIKIDDDGTAYEVFEGGRESPAGHVNHLQQFKSTWSIPELENMVRGQMMEEIKQELPEMPVLPTAEHAEVT